MRRKIITVSSSLLILILLSAIAFSNQVITDFQIGFMVDKVYLKWKSTQEEDVKEYTIERSFDKVAYNKIGTVKPKGNFSSYQYIDKNIFKSSARTFYYRIKVVYEDGTKIQSKVLQLTPRVSSAKQTWGSIKAIFH
ncbi:hypothetical protein ACFL6L_02360 [candidate division KSB1 bacterium]